MKRIILCILVVVLWSCNSSSQTLNQEIIKEGQKPYLLGKINKEGLASDHYKEWFLSGYNEYQPDSTIISQISKKLDGYSILLFMGTWCGDSRREVPRFFKVLNVLNFPKDQLTMVAVGREKGMYKQSPTHEEKGLNIHRVPIFIFCKNDKEVGRIVEHPVTTLEDDILRILNNNYEPNYSIVDEVHAIIDNENFYEKALSQLEVYKMKAKNMYALNTYSRILMTTNRQGKALEVLRLNTILFPNDPKTHMSLANVYVKLDDKKKALLYYEEALKINPDNSKLSAKIEQLKSELSGSSN